MMRKRHFPAFITIIALGTLCGYPSAGWSQIRTFVSHQITSIYNSPNPGPRYQPRISHDGNRAVFLQGDAVRVINFDGSALTTADSCQLCYALDISDDGSRVISSPGMTLRIANANGSGQNTLVSLSYGWFSDIRISGDGNSVFFYLAQDATTQGGTPLRRGVWAINSNGTSLSPVVVVDQIAALLGISADQVNMDYSGGQTLDVSDDGQRVIFGIYDRFFGANRNGTGLHEFPPGHVSQTDRSVISGDGTRVAQAYTADGLWQVHIMNWDGGARTKVADQNDIFCNDATCYLGRLSLNINGRFLLLGNLAVLIDTVLRTREQLGVAPTWSGPPDLEPSLIGWNELAYATMEDNATRLAHGQTRFVFVARVAGTCTSSAYPSPVLATLEIDPTTLGAAPLLSGPFINPTTVIPNDYASFGVTVSASNEINYVGMASLFEGIKNWSERYLADTMEDQGGGFYYTGFLVNTNVLGPRTIRFEAEVHESTTDGCRMHATAIDVVPFAVTDSTPVPGMAMLISPSGSTNTPTPTYTWYPVQNAIWYRLFVNDSAGNTIDQTYKASDVCTASLCLVTPTTALPAGSATWWVQASNNGGPGAWSTGLNFTVVSSPPQAATLISPSGSLTTATPTYIWNAVSNATSYRLLVQDAAGTRIDQWYSPSVAGCASGQGTCSITPSTALASGTGQWWVQTKNSSGEGPLSASLSFTVYSAPGAATLISPSGAIQTTTPTYTWSADAGSTWYYLWVDDITGNRIKQWVTAAQAGCGSGTGTCAVTSQVALASGSAQWWIQTYNASGYGPWSKGMVFTVPAPVLPGKATLISPSGTIQTTTPAYTWNADSTSTWYYLWVDDSTGNRIKQWYAAAQAGCGSGTGTCSITPDVPVRGTSKWWIQTWSSVGYGPWSTGMSFTAPAPVLPGKATLISPSGAIQATTPTYTWNAVTNSTWYYLWVDDSTGNRIKGWYTVAETGCGSGSGTCQVTPGTALAQGNYAWWIQTYGNGGYGPWSNQMNFTVGGQAKHIHYDIDKITGTDYGCQPRDTSHETEGDLPGLQGTIPISYSETWDGGYANMTGSIVITPAVPPSGHEGETWVKIDASASWSNQGLGCCRYTGIFFSGCTGSNDDKGCFQNGSTSAGASCTGPAAGIKIQVSGKETRIVQLSLVQ